ncbi:MAG: peptide deformylase [Actinomycetota bacterium]|nr:peptide deformylase [Actinomycetota bacterium]
MSEVHGQVREQERDPQQEARRRVALSQIRQFGDPVLRMKARPVEAFDADLAKLVERMKRLMADAQGVGLAATQVGILQRIAVIQPANEEEPRVLVNPEIVARGAGKETDDEGCLSLQGVLVPVERDLHVTVAAKDESGADLRLELEALTARVAQHELDHLDGILVLDRTTPEARREALGILRPRLVLS